MTNVNKLADKLIAEKFHGAEPIYKKAISTKSDPMIGKLLNWYNFMAQDKDKDNWLTDYMKNNGYTKSDISSILSLQGLGAVSKNSASILSRIESNGTIFSGELEGIVKSKIERALSFKQEVEEKETTPKVVSIQDRVKALAEPHVIFVDDEISSWYENRKKKMEFSLYDYLLKNQLNSQICNHIKSCIVSRYQEHAEMVEGNDEQLNEAYAYLSVASKKEILKQLKVCLSDIERYVGNTKAAKPKQTRKKKPISVAKQINNLKYQKEFTKFKIKSISPESIIGAQQLWVFNTKYNHLSMLNTDDPKGFSVKGTTVLNIDTQTSIKKTVRKPEEAIQKVLNGGKVVLKKLMSELKTKPIDVNGRLNDDCILLKAIK